MKFILFLTLTCVFSTSVLLANALPVCFDDIPNHVVVRYNQWLSEGKVFCTWKLYDDGLSFQINEQYDILLSVNMPSGLQLKDNAYYWYDDLIATTDWPSICFSPKVVDKYASEYDTSDLRIKLLILSDYTIRYSRVYIY